MCVYIYTLGLCVCVRGGGTIVKSEPLILRRVRSGAYIAGFFKDLILFVLNIRMKKRRL